MLTLGTGIGCGLILNRKLYQGSHGLIEAGHMIINTYYNNGDCNDALVCPCGQKGCIEMYGSAKNIVNLYNSTNHNTSNNEEVNGKVVFDRYSKGEKEADLVIKQAARYLAITCINICRVVDPDVIIFAGGLSNAGNILLDQIRIEVLNNTWKVLPTEVQLVSANGIDHVGVIGAALAAKSSFCSIDIDYIKYNSNNEESDESDSNTDTATDTTMNEINHTVTDVISNDYINLSNNNDIEIITNSNHKIESSNTEVIRILLRIYCGYFVICSTAIVVIGLLYNSNEDIRKLFDYTLQSENLHHTNELTYEAWRMHNNNNNCQIPLQNNNWLLNIIGTTFMSEWVSLLYILTALHALVLLGAAATILLLLK